MEPYEITQLSFRDRIREAFKEVRRAGVAARMGASYDVGRKLQRDHRHWVFYGSYENPYFASDGSYPGTLTLYCSTGSRGRVIPILRKYGLDATTRHTPHIDLRGVDNSLIEGAYVTRDKLLAGHTID